MGVSVSAAKDVGMPAIYLHLLAGLLRSLGIDDRRLLRQVGLDPTRLTATDLRVSQPQASEFVTRAIIESGEPGLGIMLARAFKMHLHGTLGIAVMNSPTLEEALELMARFLTLRAPQLRVCKRELGANRYYSVSCDTEPGPLRRFILDAMLFGCALMGTQLTGGTVSGAEVLRRGPEPDYYQRFQAGIPVPVHYGAAKDALVFPLSSLGLPVRFSNGQLAASSRAQCEDALKQLSGTAGFACRTRRVVETSHPFPPKLARVAATLFVSERTLKRRLQEEGMRFQGLVDEVRLARAKELLENTDIHLGQIAEALGYADAANFTRAFKRWTGASPSLYRRDTLLLTRGNHPAGSHRKPDNQVSAG